MQFKLKNIVNGFVTAEKIQDTLWLHFNGKIIAVDAHPPKTEKRKSSEAEGSLLIFAPMPGKMTKILTSIGSPVKKGQALAMMEAMKMEYTLKAEVDGVVRAVHVKEGEQVVLGKELIVLQKQVQK